MLESTAAPPGVEREKRPKKLLQNVFLVMDPERVRHFRWVIHRAQRVGTSGRKLIVNPKCQIYPEYFDCYRVLVDLFSITGEREIIAPWRPCGHCFRSEAVIADAFSEP